MEQSAAKLIRKFLQNGAGAYRTVIEVLTRQKVATDYDRRRLLDCVL